MTALLQGNLIKVGDQKIFFEVDLSSPDKFSLDDKSFLRNAKMSDQFKVDCLAIKMGNHEGKCERQAGDPASSGDRPGASGD
jgi:hypothetical protein